MDSAQRNSTPHRVVIALTPAIHFVREVIAGVSQYANEQGGWVIRLAPLEAPDQPWINRWQADGVILQKRFHSSPPLGDLGCPVVSVTECDDPDVAVVGVSNLELGRTAAEHLLDLGLKQILYVGAETLTCDPGRREGVRRIVAHHHATCHIFDGFGPVVRDTGMAWSDQHDRLAKFLKQLPKPLGVVAYSDWVAVHVLEVCHRIGIRVPDDLAIVGIDNDEVFCEAAHPRLSSVQHPGREIGYTAAKVLAQCMTGKAMPFTPTLLPIGGIAVRDSSDYITMDCPHVRRAMRYIRQHVHRPLPVQEVVDHVSELSRRHLERRFRETIGQSILHMIHRSRMDRARHLISSTTLSMEQIANQTGFGSASRMASVFKRHSDQPPSAYRRV